MMTYEIYLVLFEILFGMLVLFKVGTSPYIKLVVQCLNLRHYLMFGHACQ